ncbi:MAG TPA: 30S ribosome-binding factor RbfA [Deltaproteobacteria bacterium]|jgi:ribosome-binding factor A|nr:30S ribosome-binding factor RbfA [Deltaproteobacteria bacterium]HRW79744.1 30S ribosome-binding factor RbfA [Desulfomonilia bacterium]HNQ84739.1 30S ribosome-binding factor RbfA [Deltaproteobacteria bacterium]HNS88431.1 30S ribosome-binding factor RbfA [Deltaproteobacteria bacterium]HOA43335.1 30S ribosome-binding factor RbfA [Deltaproteobacteria bacterium]
MKMLSIRQARVGDLIRQTVAELVQRRVKDPRVEGITITGADVSVDLKVGHIFFCVMDPSRKEEALEGLRSSAGFLRHELKKTLRLKTVPSLSFSYDESFDYGSKIDELLDHINKHED